MLSLRAAAHINGVSPVPKVLNWRKLGDLLRAEMSEAEIDLAVRPRPPS